MGKQKGEHMDKSCSVPGCNSYGICRDKEGKRLCVKHWQEQWKAHRQVEQASQAEPNTTSPSQTALTSKGKVKGICKLSEQMVSENVPFQEALETLKKLYLEAGKEEKVAALFAKDLLWNACKKLNVNWKLYKKA